MLTDDERFMSAALDLAQSGRGKVEPNPMVGALLVRDGVVLAEGWHRYFGGPHAEIEALSAAREAGAIAQGATMYVTLEPCCHHGKTPPCTDAIIDAGIARVVIALEDPDENVAGGVKKLRDAGIEVTTGVGQAKAKQLLAAYIKLRTEHKPWVICKWAQTADGFITLPDTSGRWISGEASRDYTHKLRGMCDGILVGIGTVLVDDPLLTNRNDGGKQPVRVVLDSKLQTPLDCQLVQTIDIAPLLIATTKEAASNQSAQKLRSVGAELLALPCNENGLDLNMLLDELGKRNWTYLLVEGGAKVLGSFIYSNLADELLTFVAPSNISGSTKGLVRFDISEISKAISPIQTEEQKIGEDTLLRYVLRD